MSLWRWTYLYSRYKEALPASPRAEFKRSITSKYISKRVDCNNWYMCRQHELIGPCTFTIGSVLNLTWTKNPGSGNRADQCGAKRRISTYPPHPRTSHAQDNKTPAFLGLWISFRKWNTISFWGIASCWVFKLYPPRLTNDNRAKAK